MNFLRSSPFLPTACLLQVFILLCCGLTGATGAGEAANAKLAANAKQIASTIFFMLWSPRGMKVAFSCAWAAACYCRRPGKERTDKDAGPLTGPASVAARAPTVATVALPCAASSCAAGSTLLTPAPLGGEARNARHDEVTHCIGNFKRRLQKILAHQLGRENAVGGQYCRHGPPRLVFGGIDTRVQVPLLRVPAQDMLVVDAVVTKLQGNDLTRSGLLVVCVVNKVTNKTDGFFRRARREEAT